MGAGLGPGVSLDNAGKARVAFRPPHIQADNKFPYLATQGIKQDSLRGILPLRRPSLLIAIHCRRAERQELYRRV